MKRNSLSFRIISRVLLFCVILFLLTFTVYYIFARVTIEKSTRENAQLLAENAILKIEQVLKPLETIPDNLSWMMESGALPEDSIFAFLESMVRNNKSVYGSAIAFEPYMFNPSKQYFAPYACRTENETRSFQMGSAEYNYFIMDWYQIPAMIREPYWTEPYYDEGGGEALITTYSVPFYLDIKGKRTFAGIITVDVSLDWLTEIVNSVKIFDTGYAFLITKTGTFVTSPDRFRNRIMNETMFSIAKESGTPELREIGREMIHGKSGYRSINYDERGKLWVYYLQIPSTKWSIGVVFPDKEMFADLRQLNGFVLLVSMLGLVLLVFITIRIIRKLTEPLSQFAKTAQVIAKGNFNTELPVITSNDEMKELHDSFEFMQKELTNYVANLKETTSAKEKIESELRIAKEIQLGMIPHIFPPFPNLPEIDLFASLVSAREVGGDLYDFFLLNDDLLCFAIGDVSGKGIPSSLFMAVTRTLLRSVADHEKGAAETVATINKTLSMNNDSNMFVTFFLGILDTKTGKLSYCNAGHNPPILIRDGKEASFFSFSKSIPIGLFDTFDYTEDTVTIHAGDQLFLYTDGVTEAEDIDNKLYGNDQLLKVVSEHASAIPKKLIEEVNKDIAVHVNGHVQSDDLTMMSIIYHGRKH